MEQSIPIFTIADWNFRAPLQVMLTSLDRHLAPAARLRVCVLSTPESVGRFESIWQRSFDRLEVSFVAVDPKAFAQFPVGSMGLMTYARLLLEDRALCPWDRVLYLDSDILVRRDLSELVAAVAAQTTAIAGVRECGVPTVSSKGGVFNWRQLALDPHQPYLNAGVLGLRMDLIRSSGLFRRALDHLREYGPQVIFCDQGALNAVLGGDFSLWPMQYNFTTSCLNVTSRRKLERLEGRPCCSLADVTIAHFTGGGVCRPWHVNSISPFAKEYAAYFRAADRPEFPNDQTRLENWLGEKLARLVRKIVSLLTYVH
jgi:lipopolysaccharide biosynthesis glycosyltransferase